MKWSILLLFAAAFQAFAHCDGLDGPVVQAARTALDRGDARPALIWIQPGDEAELRTAFATTLAVRKLGPEAREMADRSFFETLVRLHRAGEGAPYTGLKPAGRDLGPAIPAADRAIAERSLDPVAKLLAANLRERFDRVLRARGFPSTDVEAGRRYVQAYVEFMHFVEALGSGQSHGPDHEREH